MVEVIDRFADTYEFLSNFASCKVTYSGTEFYSTEAAFQAAKSMDLKFHANVSLMTPSQAKRAGRTVALRSDWEQVKDEIMLDLLRQKFAKGTDLAQKLEETGDKILVEGTTWHDQYWGICLCDKHHGLGRNILGQLLMQVRSENRGKEVVPLSHKLRNDWFQGGPYKD